jgi:hypothetical protein
MNISLYIKKIEEIILKQRYHNIINNEFRIYQR